MSAMDVVITERDFSRLTDLVRRSVLDEPYRRRLEQELRRGSVVPSNGVPRRVVTMNSRVRIRDLDTGDRSVYTLVYPRDADIERGWLSVLAPLGTALLGARVGQTVQARVPMGTRTIQVERILYQPEAAGDFHL